jgi:D-glycero-D-manno-heptose 1,7-bisphosphate phosphatase
MIKNIFFDRDGVINYVVHREKYETAPWTFEEFKLNPQFIELYHSLKGQDYNMFVVSNQPDVTRGDMKQEDLDKITKVITDMFDFKEIVYCYDSEDTSFNKKPNPGMMLGLIERHNLNKDETIMVGDTWKDIEASHKAGIKTIYIKNNYNKLNSYLPDFEVDTLHEVEEIINKLNKD